MRALAVFGLIGILFFWRVPSSFGASPQQRCWYGAVQAYLSCPKKGASVETSLWQHGDVDRDDPDPSGGSTGKSGGSNSGGTTDSGNNDGGHHGHDKDKHDKDGDRHDHDKDKHDKDGDHDKDKHDKDGGHHDHDKDGKDRDRDGDKHDKDS